MAAGRGGAGRPGRRRKEEGHRGRSLGVAASIPSRRASVASRQRSGGSLGRRARADLAGEGGGEIARDGGRRSRGWTPGEGRWRADLPEMVDWGEGVWLEKNVCTWVGSGRGKKVIRCGEYRVKKVIRMGWF